MNPYILNLAQKYQDEIRGQIHAQKLITAIRSSQNIEFSSPINLLRGIAALLLSFL